MKILVTGATGFIGNYVVEELLNQNIEVIAISTNANKAQNYRWFNDVKYIQHDIYQTNNSFINDLEGVKKVIHLAWSNITDVKSLHHFEVALLPHYNFLKLLIKSGLSDITVSGTCLEYGMHNGGLSAIGTPADPQTPYAIAKDSLRKYLQQLQREYKFNLKWLRLFYMYGKGQSKKSIIPQLQQALAAGDKVFNMSLGEQLRDYLPVEDVAKKIVNNSLNDNLNGVMNCCSGTPTSIKNLVENYLHQHKKRIVLNFGYYPYPDYEPMEFWGKD